MNIYLAVLCWVATTASGMSWSSFHKNLLQDIQGARRSVVVETPEFDDSQVAISLGLARFRGCEVKVKVQQNLSKRVQSIKSFTQRIASYPSISRTKIYIDGVEKYRFQGGLVEGFQRSSSVEVTDPPVILTGKAPRQKPETDISRAYSYDKQRSSGKTFNKARRLPRKTVLQKAVNGGIP